MGKEIAIICLAFALLITWVILLLRWSNSVDRADQDVKLCYPYALMASFADKQYVHRVVCSNADGGMEVK